MPTRIHFKEENQVCASATEDGFKLCLQWVRYNYENGEVEEGYRFIWRYPNGNLQPARGQARIPSLALARELMDKAVAAGWGEMASDDAVSFSVDE